MNGSYAIVGAMLREAARKARRPPVVYHPSNLGFKFPRQFRELAAIGNQWRFFNDAQVRKQSFLPTFFVNMQMTISPDRLGTITEKTHKERSVYAGLVVQHRGGRERARRWPAALRPRPASTQLHR
jgi:hypothetical protein